MGLMQRLRFFRDHRLTHNHMSEYLDDEVPPNARERIRRHLDECEDCSTWFDGMRVIVTELARFRRVEEPEVAPAVLAGVREGMGEADGRDG